MCLVCVLSLMDLGTGHAKFDHDEFDIVDSGVHPPPDKAGRVLIRLHVPCEEHDKANQLLMLLLLHLPCVSATSSPTAWQGCIMASSLLL